MALLRFFVSTALEARLIGFGSCAPNPSVPWVRPTRRLDLNRPCRRILCRRRSRDSSLEACSPPGSVPVSRPRPSCGFASTFQRTIARRFRASFPGWSRPRSWCDLARLPQSFPLGSSPPPPWLTVSFPGHPLLRFPLRARVRTPSGAPESCVAAESACHGWLPTLWGFSTFRSRGVDPPRPIPVLKDRRCGRSCTSLAAVRAWARRRLLYRARAGAPKENRRSLGKNEQ
jgi:hypothetical protein